jgi:hypothetical protein
VRRIVAQRLPMALLDRLVFDDDLLVRWEVSQRAQPDLLQRMQDDPDTEVRAAVHQRLYDTGVQHG